MAPIVEQHPDVRERAELEPDRAEPEPALAGERRAGADAPIEQPADEVLADLLIEEVSIDGMCGVY